MEMDRVLWGPKGLVFESLLGNRKQRFKLPHQGHVVRCRRGRGGEHSRQRKQKYLESSILMKLGPMSL